MKLINSFHGATCICSKLSAKLFNEEQRSAKTLLVDVQTNPKILGRPSKNVGSNLEENFLHLPGISWFPLSNRGVTALPTGLAHGVPGVDGLMTKHPTTR